MEEILHSTSSNPRADYSGQIEMKAGDTITFAVGYGKNKTHFGDTTGLFAKIVLQPEGGHKGGRSERQHK